MKIRKRILVFLLPLTMLLTVVPGQKASAVPIALIMEVIKAGVKKVIQAIDLKVQRLQNQTIWLQNAQKILENKLHKLKLDGLSEWNENQRRQYSELFNELWEVKGVLTGMQRLRDIAEMQRQIIREYQLAWSRIGSSPVLTSGEKQLMGSNYRRILEESLENLSHLTGVMSSFTAQMNDAERLAMLHLAGDRIRGNLQDLRKMNAGNLSLVRSRENFQMETLKQNYDVD